MGYDNIITSGWFRQHTSEV